jgi:hypothetical protein
MLQSRRTKPFNRSTPERIDTRPVAENRDPVVTSITKLIISVPTTARARAIKAFGLATTSLHCRLRASGAGVLDFLIVHQGLAYQAPMPARPVSYDHCLA